MNLTFYDKEFGFYSVSSKSYMCEKEWEDKRKQKLNKQLDSAYFY